MHALRIPEQSGLGFEAPDAGRWLRAATDAMRGMAGATAGSRVLDVTAAALDVAESSFDAAVCGFGLMFFPDPLQVLRDMHRALRPGGGVCTMVFARPERIPCLTVLMPAALKHAGPPARDADHLLSLGRPGRIEELLKAAGFRDVATPTIDADFRMPSVFGTPAGREGPNELLLTAGRCR